MKRFYYRHIYKSKNIIGILLCVIGFLIMINYISREIIIFLMGSVFLIIGGLMLKVK